MGSRSCDIANALVTAWSSAYAAARVSQNIVVTRTWYQVTKKAIATFPQFDHANILANTVRVFVMSMEEQPSQEDDSRRLFMVEYPIQVGIAAYLKTNTPADIDPLMQVSQELRDYCMQLSDPGYSLGIPEGVVGVPEIVCDPDKDALARDKLFLSAFVLTFEGGRGR